MLTVPAVVTASWPSVSSIHVAPASVYGRPPASADTVLLPVMVMTGGVVSSDGVGVGSGSDDVACTVTVLVFSAALLPEESEQE